MRDALGDRPLDALVRALLDDRCLELLGDAPDLRLERDGAVVLLGRLLQPVHELRPLLKLGELVVGRRQRNSHIHLLLDRHPPALADTRCSLLGLISASGTWEHSLAGLGCDTRGAARLIDLLADGVLDALADGVLEALAHLLGDPGVAASVLAG